MNERALIGCLLGTATGDALGLPYEGLSARRAARLFPDTGRHHLLFGKGMVSDDTEHSCFVAAALARAGDDPDQFAKFLARSMRWWLAGLPAGIGFATLRATLKLWLGWPPTRSGVHSAGNGPAMRSALIGVALGHSPESLGRYVAASTRITHTDPKAYYAALAVALAAHHSATSQTLSPEGFLTDLTSTLPDPDAAEFLELVRQAADAAAKDQSVAVFASRIGSSNGISGYSYHTVPCVLQTWFRHPDDFARGLQEIIRAGGDTDTAGAIYGGIVGARVGKEGIPSAWRENILEWPRSLGWMERMAVAVARQLPVPGYFSAGLILRNLVFLVLVLGHGLRRLAPPY